MSSAVITYCGHFFHGNCLRKWLYVQETCPMCHQTVQPTPPGQSQASGDAPEAPAQRDAGPDPAAQEGDQNQNNDTSQETRSESEAVTPDPSEQQDQTGGFADGDREREDKADGEAAEGLRFSSSGDFVGFVGPVSSSSLADVSSKTFPPYVQVEESGKDPPLPSTLNAVNENTAENQSDSNGAEFNVTSCPRVPQNGDRIPKSWNSLSSPESNNTNTNLEASGFSLDSQTSFKSCNSKLLDCNDDPQIHKGNGTYSDSDLDGLEEADNSDNRD